MQLKDKILNKLYAYFLNTELLIEIVLILLIIAEQESITQEQVCPH